MLEKTGALLRGTFSDDDYLGRIGGDEFCVLVNRQYETEEELREYAEALCIELCNGFRSTFEDELEGKPVSASVGAAIFPTDGSSFAELYASCDKALYHAKRKGKNRYSFYDPEESEGDKA